MDIVTEVAFLWSFWTKITHHHCESFLCLMIDWLFWVLHWQQVIKQHPHVLYTWQSLKEGGRNRTGPNVLTIICDWANPFPFWEKCPRLPVYGTHLRTVLEPQGVDYDLICSLFPKYVYSNYFNTVFLKLSYRCFADKIVINVEKKKKCTPKLNALYKFTSKVCHWILETNQGGFYRLKYKVIVSKGWWFRMLAKKNK